MTLDVIFGRTGCKIPQYVIWLCRAVIQPHNFEIIFMSIVTLIDGIPIVTSLSIAEYYDKVHRNVLRSIRKILKNEPELGLVDIYKSTYINKQNKLMPCYNLTERGFMIFKHRTMISIPKNNNTEGYVYVMYTDSRVKLGMSKTPNNRVKSIAKSMGSLNYKSYIGDKVSNARRLEYLMHEHFKADRLIGEWFNIPFDCAINTLNELQSGLK